MAKKRVVEAIRAHLRRPKRVELTEDQKELWRRIDHAWALLVDTKNVKTDVEKTDVLCYTYKVALNTAYQYLQWAKELYGDFQEGNKSANRAIVFAYAQEAFRMGVMTRNAGAMASAVSQMTKILGLDRDEPDTPDFSQINPPTVILGLPEETQKQLLLLVQAGVVDLTKSRSAQDAEYIDITDVNSGELSKPG
jgi:hypothetical protein